MLPLDIAHDDITTLNQLAPDWDSHWARLLTTLAFDDLALQHQLWLIAKGDKRKATLSQLDAVVDDPRFTALTQREKLQYCRVVLTVCKGIPVGPVGDNPKDWTLSGENLRSKRYPHIVTTPEGRIYYEAAHTEYYYNPATDSVDTMTLDMDLSGKPILYLPDLPFEAHYADPFARVPIQGIPRDYRAHVRPLVISRDTVNLTYARATSVVRCVTSIVRSKYLHGRFGLSVDDYLRDSRVPVPQILREGVRYALATYPSLPFPCGEFTALPTLMERYDETGWELTPLYDVAWVPRGFAKATLRLSYNARYELNLVYVNDDRPVNTSTLKETHHATFSRR